jgi:hypothetical protein
MPNMIWARNWPGADSVLLTNIRARLDLNSRKLLVHQVLYIAMRPLSNPPHYRLVQKYSSVPSLSQFRELFLNMVYKLKTAIRPLGKMAECMSPIHPTRVTATNIQQWLWRQVSLVILPFIHHLTP